MIFILEGGEILRARYSSAAVLLRHDAEKHLAETEISSHLGQSMEDLAVILR